MNRSSSGIELVAMDPNRERRLGPLFVGGGFDIVPTVPLHGPHQPQGQSARPNHGTRVWLISPETLERHVGGGAQLTSVIALAAVSSLERV